MEGNVNKSSFVGLIREIQYLVYYSEKVIFRMSPKGEIDPILEVVATRGTILNL